MRKDLTDVTVVLDRSGSMSACREEAENGVNHFVEKQTKEPGDAVFSLVQFDTEYEFVHRGMPIEDVPTFHLVPRGMTALLDAVGRAINETGERLSKMPEVERPGLVVFVIVTDGQENSSHEFTKSQIKQMIEHQQSVYNWKFTFLGANQNSFAEAGGLGIARAATSDFSSDSCLQAFAAAGASVSRMRRASANDETVACYFTDAERDTME
ncbi:MAG: VWA domain-containing protein [Planctomycetaceae bacterium]|nr:VWA domain-containing protein [Planctomycetales bacterium]MCB9924258.1 VWA domain-containing protein [Planctomycetaceae bacterium]